MASNPDRWESTLESANRADVSLLYSARVA
jgi:hypothetical protein